MNILNSFSPYFLFLHFIIGKEVVFQDKEKYFYLSCDTSPHNTTTQPHWWWVLETEKEIFKIKQKYSLPTVKQRLTESLDQSLSFQLQPKISKVILPLSLWLRC